MEWKEDEKIKENNIILTNTNTNTNTDTDTTATTSIIKPTTTATTITITNRKGILSTKTKINKMKENKNRVVFSPIPQGK